MIFWALFSTAMVTMLHKGLLVTSLLKSGDLSIETLLCMCGFLIQLTGFCLSMASTFKPQETADVLNSWDYVMTILEKIHGRKVTAFDEIASAIQIVTSVAVISGIAMALSMTMTVLLFPGLPMWGLVDIVVARDGGPWLFPAWLWKIALLPLELVVFVPPLFTAAFNGCMFMVSSGGLWVRRL